MERDEISRDLADLVRKIMYKKGIRQYNLNVEGHSNIGDNYVGDITFFNVTSKENGAKYHLVMKTAKRSEEIRKIMGNGKFYTREMYMYSEVFPTLRAFGRETNNSFQLENIPKAYWVSHENKRETVILENKKASGYGLRDRSIPMNLDHVLLVLKNYGMFHALSLAMKNRNPELFETLTENLDNVMVDFCETNQVNSIFEGDLKNAMKLLIQAGREDLVEKFQTIVNNLEYQIVKESKKEDKFVITHGDCWTNNMLFQYKDENITKPKKMCFLDFQMSTFDSPVKDLSYFIYACSDKDTLDKFDLLLSTYYDSLSSTMSSLGCQSNSFFTLENLKDDWKKYAVSGLMLATLVIKLCLSNSEEVPDMNEIGKTQDLAKAFNIQIANADVYNRRILDIYIHFGDNCL